MITYERTAISAMKCEAPYYDGFSVLNSQVKKLLKEGQDRETILTFIEGREKEIDQYDYAMSR